MLFHPFPTISAICQTGVCFNGGSCSGYSSYGINNNNFNTNNNNYGTSYNNNYNNNHSYPRGKTRHSIDDDDGNFWDSRIIAPKLTITK